MAFLDRNRLRGIVVKTIGLPSQQKTEGMEKGEIYQEMKRSYTRDFYDYSMKGEWDLASQSLKKLHDLFHSNNNEDYT